jgi:anthranilate/para-aminobenzoate synthase component I
MQSAGDIKAEQEEEEEPSNPCAREIEIAPDILLRALLQLDAWRRVQILDSCGARSPQEARYLIAGFDPFEIIEARGSELRIWKRDTGAERFVRGEVLVALDERLKSYYAPPAPLFDVPAMGACIATFSYELAHRLDRLRINTARHIISEPDAVLAFYDTLVIHDYARGVTQIVSRSGPHRLEQTFEAIKDAATRAASVWSQDAGFSRQAVARRDTDFSRLPLAVSGQNVTSNFTRDEYPRGRANKRAHRGGRHIPGQPDAADYGRARP